MRFRLTFITGMSLLFMAAGLYLSFFGAEGSGGQRYFFTTIGILGWFIGNRIVELDERVANLEKALSDRKNTIGPPEPEAVAECGIG
jgi:hypothetical protein